MRLSSLRFVGCLWVAGLTVAALAACSEDPLRTDDGRPTPINALPRSLTADELTILSGSNEFGLSLLAELVRSRPGENVFMSPLSASMALGMTLNGADAATFAQMAATLGFAGLDQEDINEAYRSLLDLLRGLDPRVLVEIGNSIWHQQGAPVLPDFVQRVEEHFDAEVAGVNFGDGATLDRINGWVEEATNGTIRILFDALPPDVLMVLVNAVYFKGDWTDAFDADRTREEPFTRSDGSQASVPLMTRDGDYRYSRMEGLQVVELPYGGDAFTMTLVLPDPGVAVAELLEGLDAVRWESWTADLPEQRVGVGLPRFELEWESSLNDPLQALGMVDAFDPALADFSRLVSGGGTWIDLVFQKSFVSIDEEGTEASAATGVIMPTSLPPQVWMDRPFVLAIRERLSGTLLFLGLVEDPSA